MWPTGRPPSWIKASESIERGTHEDLCGREGGALEWAERTEVGWLPNDSLERENVEQSNTTDFVKGRINAGTQFGDICMEAPRYPLISAL
jgi:hypothetical protein